MKPTVAKMVAAEQAAGLLTLAPYRKLAERAQTIKSHVVAAVRERKAQGKSVVGFGAAVGTTALLYFFDIAKDIDYLADDNPVRQGLFSPGHHIPVIPSTELAARRPDSVIVFPWRYTEPILKNQTAYLKNGGEFIVPLPDVKVIRK